MAPTILIIGSLNTDLVTRTPRMPQGGETLTASSFTTGHGGKGANQAIACARLSRTSSTITSPTVEVRMAGAVGDDVYGPSMITALQDSGIETKDVKMVKGQPTGTAVILVEETSGQNRILLNPGANHTLRPEDFTEKLCEDGTVPEMVILQLEIPLDTTVQILKTAKRLGVKVLWNPAPAIVLPEEVYPDIDTLVVNETEAAILSGKKDESELDLSESGLRGLAADFLKRGVSTVLITLGGKGVFYASATASGLVQAKKVSVVDTTAAGDTFVGAFAVAVLKGLEIGDAVSRANSAAAISVGREGAQTSIPWMDEVEA